VSELEPAVVSDLAAPEAAPELAPFERHRLAQREAERETSFGYLPRVLHPGNEQIPPLVRLPSGAAYAVRGHENGSGHVTLVRVDRAPKSKKERRRLRELAKAQRAAMAPTEDLCRDGAREARQAHNLEISGCDSQPCNQPSQESPS